MHGEHFDNFATILCVNSLFCAFMLCVFIIFYQHRHTDSKLHVGNRPLIFKEKTIEMLFSTMVENDLPFKLLIAKVL